MQKPFPSDAAPLGTPPSEDCLFLNVWTPTTSQTAKAPVVVWIYGGGSVNGGSSPDVYDGSEFAKSGVVFVSFNYRLGRFGFFAHPELSKAKGHAVGNFGIEDQLAALQWVNENIASFGGDPDKVTIMGESAGGRSVHLLMQIESGRSYYQQAVIMSGGGRDARPARHIANGSKNNPSAQQIGSNMAKRHGLPVKGAEALNALRALSAEQVTDDLNLSQLYAPPAGEPTYVGGPFIDGHLIKLSTETALAKAKVAAIPIMVGTTSEDIGFSIEQNKADLFAQFENQLADAKQAYDPTDNAAFNDVAYAVGQDKYMQEPARFVAKRLSYMDQPVYFYRFGYVAQSIRNGEGAKHATDIPFFFNTVDKKYPDATAQDLAMSNTMFTMLVNYIKSMLVNYIKSGLPTTENRVTWRSFHERPSYIMEFTFDGKATFEPDPFYDRLNVIEASR